MTHCLALALAQINPVVGDLIGNLALIRSARQQAAEMGAGLVAFPALALTGAPLKDLAQRGDFLDDCQLAMENLAKDTADGGPSLLIGLPLKIRQKLCFCAALLDGGHVVKLVCQDQPLLEPIPFQEVRLGILFDEDLWTPESASGLHKAGAELLLTLGNGAFEIGVSEKRQYAAAKRATDSHLPLIFLNLFGGQDELVFDGASFVLDAHGATIRQLPDWQSKIALTLWQRDDKGVLACLPEPLTPLSQGHAAIYSALVCALRDYVHKNRFPGVVLGLSGGIDSALAAAIAVDALGSDKVWAVMMPSCYTSQESLEDAASVARYLGARLDVIPIGPAMQAFETMLEPLSLPKCADVAQENIQARSRGLTLMAISNRFGPMALATGNKSEFSVGYATLYGDMCGGYAILKDLYKTAVFALSAWRNQHKPHIGLGPDGPVMPERVIAKPPSAELKPNQTDQDRLPPYDVLDGILHGLIEEQASQANLIARGYDRNTVQQVWDMLDHAEYKRQQAPPGVKITRCSFGLDRRYPIANRYRGRF